MNIEKALKLLKNSRERKRAILRFYKIKQFFLLLKNNSIAREFILKKMDECGIWFDVDIQLNDEFFSDLIDLFKLECLGVVVFNHSLFQFVHQTHSIPYRLNKEQNDEVIATQQAMTKDTDAGIKSNTTSESK